MDHSYRSFPKLTAVAVIVLTCALAGCGRKAGLDLPPTAANGPQESAPEGPAPTSTTSAIQRDMFDPGGAADRAPKAPRGQKKRIPLDAILD